MITQDFRNDPLEAGVFWGGLTIASAVAIQVPGGVVFTPLWAMLLSLLIAAIGLIIILAAITVHIHRGGNDD